VITSQPHIAPFSTRGLLDYLVELIVSEDDVFYLLDKPAFQQLIHYLHPTLTLKDIPHRTKMHKVSLPQYVAKLSSSWRKPRPEYRQFVEGKSTFIPSVISFGRVPSSQSPRFGSEGDRYVSVWPASESRDH
jgi:hypothetical protein